MVGVSVTPTMALALCYKGFARGHGRSVGVFAGMLYLYFAVLVMTDSGCVSFSQEVRRHSPDLFFREVPKPKQEKNHKTPKNIKTTKRFSVVFFVFSGFCKAACGNLSWILISES